MTQLRCFVSRNRRIFLNLLNITEKSFMSKIVWSLQQTLPAPVTKHCVSFIQALLKDEDVIDAAVVGVDDELRGHVPFGFIVLKKGTRAWTD